MVQVTDQKTVIQSRMEDARVDVKNDALAKSVNEGLDYEASLEGSNSSEKLDQKSDKPVQESQTQKSNTSSSQQVLSKKSVNSQTNDLSSNANKSAGTTSVKNTEAAASFNGTKSTSSKVLVKNSSIPAAKTTVPSGQGDLNSPQKSNAKASMLNKINLTQDATALNKAGYNIQSSSGDASYQKNGYDVPDGMKGYNGNYPQNNQVNSSALKAMGYGNPGWNSSWMFNSSFNRQQDEKFFNGLSEKQKAKAEYFDQLRKQNKILFLISIGEVELALSTLVSAHKKLMQEGTKMLAEKLNAVQKLRAETLIAMSELEPPEADDYDMEDANDSAEFQSDMTEYDSSMRMLNNQVQGLGNSTSEITQSLQGLKKEIDNLQEFVKSMLERKNRTESYLVRWGS